jgi:hypothetical protein
MGQQSLPEMMQMILITGVDNAQNG